MSNMSEYNEEDSLAWRVPPEISLGAGVSADTPSDFISGGDADGPSSPIARDLDLVGDDIGIYDLKSEGNGNFGSLPTLQFTALSLQGGERGGNNAGGNGSGIENQIGEASTATNIDIDDDPFVALQAAIDEDTPKMEATPEWQRMLAAVREEQETGTASMVPETQANSIQQQRDSNEIPEPSMSIDDDEPDMAAILNPTTQSPAHIFAVEEGSGVTTSGDSGDRQAFESSSGDDLAGTTTQPIDLPSSPPSSLPSSPTIITDEETAKTLEDPDELQKRTFAALHPICSRLLKFRSDIDKLTSLLHELKSAIEAADSRGLEACLDYALFPLQLALDAVASFRNSEELNPRADDASAAPTLPALASDKAAEAALDALLALISRTSCEREEQLLALLQRLCSVLVCPRERISEELRLGVLKITGAALRGAQQDALEALRMEDAAPVVGHLISLLLRNADAELHAGATGSRAVRREALCTLRSLVLAINSPDALSFFLPGLVTGLARALVDGRGVRGRRGLDSFAPAASGAAAVEALGALQATLVAALGNSDVAILEDSTRRDSDSESEGFKEGEYGQTADAMAQLVSLAEKAKRPKVPSAQKEEISTGDGGNPSSIHPPFRKEDSADGSSGNKLRVDRDVVWMQASAGRVKDLLSVAVPPLVSDPRPAVRVALAESCATLLSDCSLALESCRPLLLEALFALAQDEWPEVTQTAKKWLESQMIQSQGGSLRSGEVPHPTRLNETAPPLLATAEASLLTWLRELPAALRRGDDAGRAHALKVITCLQVCPPQWVASCVLSSSSAAGRLVATLAECFEIDNDMAGLLSQATPELHGPSYEAMQQGSSVATESNTSLKENEFLESKQQPGAMLLPRMPLGLQFISTQKTYLAVAGVIRTLAAVAAVADATAVPGSSTALQSLADSCVQQLQGHIQRSGAGEVRKKNNRHRPHHGNVDTAQPDDASGSDLHPWQLSAAQVICVFSEVILGASPAWKAPVQKVNKEKESIGADAMRASADLETVVIAAVPEMVDDAIWGLSTSVTADPEGSSLYNEGSASSKTLLLLPPTQLSAKSRGWNAVLQRASLDFIGTAARALGPRFTSNGRILRTVLLPVLEKFGEPSPMVSAAADTAVGSICANCGYGAIAAGSADGLRRLVADNADYIVDGMCRQLRQPGSYPRAPQLFAALLQHSGVASGLLPLLAEPARQALQGVSIMSRRKRPEHVLAFVLCLREIAKGAHSVANESLADIETFACLVESRKESQREEREAASLTEVNTMQEDTPSEDVEIISQYFNERRARKEEESRNVPGALGEEQGDEEGPRVIVTLDEWNDLQVTRRRSAACAALAQSTADASGPLVLSSYLPVAVQALRACREALHGLAAATRSTEVQEKRIDPIIEAPRDAVPPNDPKPATLLPSVHLLWSPLMGALDGWRVAVVECALESLSDLAQLAGSFLTRRFTQEAWPRMSRLLREGPSQQRVIAPGQDELSSPVVVQRAQRAVLRCLSKMAQDRHGPSDILAPLSSAILPAVADLMGDVQPGPVREAATTTFAAVAEIDADAAWALLVAALRTLRLSAVPCSLEPPFGFPSLSSICLMPPGTAVPKGLRTCGEAKLQAMVGQVERLPVRWHQNVAKLPGVGCMT